MLGLWSAGGSSGSHECWVFGQQVAAVVLMSTRSLVSRWQQGFSRALSLWSAGGSSGSHERWVFGQQVAAVGLMSTGSLVNRWQQWVS